MKPLLLLPFLCLVPSLHAQVTTVAVPGKIVVEQPVLDPVVVQRQLSIAPKVVVVTAPNTVVVPSQPQEVVKTTKTTTVVDTPGKPRRVYQSERNVVTVEDQNGTRELPYVTLPVLFVKETAELLDAESRAALEQMASAIRTVSQTTPDAMFDIEGHTSTDGTEEFNSALSAARAKRVYDELTLRYGVPPTTLSAHGYGESFPMYPSGNEAEMQQDRRVLVVRTK
jgi:outer membrane protein OmpA-like peptidoglycan-associated protein